MAAPEHVRHRVIASRMAKHAFTTQVINTDGEEARTMLSIERTFLAWFRTGFAISAVGIVVSRLSTQGMDPTATKTLTLMYILLGIACTLAGCIRYLHVAVLVPDKQYPLSGWLMLLVAACGLGAFVTTFVILLLKS